VEGGDSGVPIVEAEKDGPHAEAFRHVAEAAVEQVDNQPANQPLIV